MRPTIDTLLLRGGVAALLTAGAVGSLLAQVPTPPPVRVSKDTTLVLRMFSGQKGDSIRISRISIDSIRDLMRAWETEPISSFQSARMAREIEAWFTARTGFGQAGPSIVITGSDGIRQYDRGWIGLTTGGVHNESSDGRLLQYLDYPPIVSVRQRSPAQVAGIVPGDTLIAYDGVDVVAHPINLAQLLTPDKKVAVTVRRDGESKAFTVVVARQPINEMFTRRLPPGEVPAFSIPGDGQVIAVGGSDGPRRAMAPGGVGRVEVRSGPGFPGGPLFMFSTNTGVFGASMSPVSPDLAKRLKIEPGVLVNEVPDETPAFRAGLLAGDVIVRVAGEAVTSVDDVRNLAVLRAENHTVTLQIIRDKKPRSIIVK